MRNLKSAASGSVAEGACRTLLTGNDRRTGIRRLPDRYQKTVPTKPRASALRAFRPLLTADLPLVLTRNLPEIWSILKDGVCRQDAAKVSQRIDQAVAADQRTRIDYCIAADLHSIADYRAELA